VSRALRAAAVALFVVALPATAATSPRQVVALALRESPGRATLELRGDGPLAWSEEPMPGGLRLRLAETVPGATVPYELAGTSGPIRAVHLRGEGGTDWRRVSLAIELQAGAAHTTAADGDALRVTVTAPTAPSPRSAVASPPPSPTPYRLGPGDLVALDVFGVPELTRSVRVGVDGALTLPLAGRVAVDGATAEEAAARVAAALQRAQAVGAPRVVATVLEVGAPGVALAGAITTPGRYPVNGPTTLMRLLTQAGGITDAASTPARAIVLRRGASGEERRLIVDLEALRRGGAAVEDPELAAGDVVLVPAAEMISVFVSGAVRHSGAVAGERGRRLDVLQALAAAGGPTERAALDKVAVFRPLPQGGRTVIRVDVEAAQRGRQPPLPLLSGDTLFVPFWPALGQHFDVTAAELMRRAARNG
jgi:polysaccharide export outer membrane protein